MADGTLVLIFAIIIGVAGIIILLYFIFKKKKGTLKAGEVCQSDDKCINGNCGREQAGTGVKKCCPNATSEIYDGYRYCKDMPNGNLCWSDAMCGSGYCEGNAGGIKKGICTAISTPGNTCKDDRHCSNRACGHITGAVDSGKICCPSGHTHTYDDDKYCTQMPDGTVCRSNEMCASEYCKKAHEGIYERGICTAQ